MSIKRRSSNQHGKNLSDVQEMNRSLVLRLLKKHDVCSRAELARQSGLNQATITNIINDFLQWGLVKETGLIGGNKGRRSIGIQINQDEYYVIGVRLMRRQFLLGLFDIFGEVISKKVFVNESNNPVAMIEKMQREINNTLDDHSDKKILGIGIAVPGPYFRLEGKIKTITDFDGWDDIPFKKVMTESFDIPVIIDHDANASAMAEWWMVPNKFLQGTIVYLSVDEGVGAGIINDGRLFRGGLGTAGEIGHMSIDKNGEVCECGNRGCLVKCGSTTYLERTARELLPQYPETILPPDFDLGLLYAAIRQKDELAMTAFLRMAENLAVGIINIMCAYGANEIIIGNAMAPISDILLSTLIDLIKGHTFASFIERVTLRITSFEEDPIFIGSAALAIDYCLGRTSIFET